MAKLYYIPANAYCTGAWVRLDPAFKTYLREFSEAPCRIYDDTVHHFDIDSLLSNILKEGFILLPDSETAEYIPSTMLDITHFEIQQ